jgi:septum formation protein
MTTPNPIPRGPPPSYTPTAKPSSAGPPRPGPPPPLDLPALNALRGQRIVLASASPRRRALLAQIGLRDIEIVPSTFAENLDHGIGPFQYVLDTATQKALAVYNIEVNNAEKGEPALVLAADTIVVSHFGTILEKPRGVADHVDMLKKLRDEGSHRVYTAVVGMRPLESAMDPGYRLESCVEETLVQFDKEGEFYCSILAAAKS